MVEVLRHIRLIEADGGKRQPAATIADDQAARDAVKEMAGQPCSQHDLAERLKKLEDAEEPETYSALFDDGWVTESMPVRDGDQSVTVIWQADLEEIADREQLGPIWKKWPAGKLSRWTIPMDYQKRLGRYIEGTEKAGPYPIVGADILTYSTEEGGQWAKS